MKTETWNNTGEVYSPSQVEAVLRALGLNVREETENDFLSFCPFHGNDNSPAFSTSKLYGVSLCFNPACAVGMYERLSLDGLVRKVKGIDHFAAKRFIIQNRAATHFEEIWAAETLDEVEFKEFPPEAIEVMHRRFMETPAAKEYIKSRGFTRETAEHFKFGFTPATTGWDAPVYRPHDMIVVPAYNDKGTPVGLIGRSLVGKEFKNYGPDDKGRGFHKSKIIWNLQNAKKYGTIILTEATFDAASVHQAGYPNVGALLGGSLSKIQEQLLNRYFQKIVIMTDNESGSDEIFHIRCNACIRAGDEMCQGHKPGRELGMKIAERCPRLDVSWAVYDDRHIYARDVKDANGMNGDEIRQTLRNAIPHHEYLDWVA